MLRKVRKNQMSNKIQILKNKIKSVSQSYYDGEPIMSDEAFDMLTQELQTLDLDNELLKTPGWGYTPATTHLKKFKHSIPVGSLDKIKHGETYDIKNFVVTSKIDGGSAVAYYKNGKLIRILSRGNGEIGLDITANVLPSKSVPLNIPNHNILAVRGELTITWDDFKKLGGSHPRNRAVGISQSKHASPEELQSVKFIAYTIAETTQFNIYKEPRTKQNDLCELAGQGFITVEGKLFASWKEFSPWCNDWVKSSESQISIYIKNLGSISTDGLVLTQNDTQESIAYKFKGDEVETEVININWKMTRTGRLVPVLKVEPVDVSGAVINNVMANNVEWIQEMACGKGAKIRIIRSGEIIPYVTEVLEPQEPIIPNICPECNTKLIHVNRDLICNNPECPAKSNVSLYRIFELVKVDGIGGTIIKELLRRFNVTGFDELKTLINEITLWNLSSFGPVTSEKLFGMIQKIRTQKISLSNLLWIANIPHLGNKATKVIEKELNLEEYVKNPDIAKEITGLPSYLAYDSFIDHEWKIKQLIEFFGIQNIIKEVKPMEEIKVAITGTLSKPRKEIEKDLNDAGFTLAGINKDTKYLICNVPSTSSKYMKAMELGIMIVTENEFWKMFE